MPFLIRYIWMLDFFHGIQHLFLCWKVVFQHDSSLLTKENVTELKQLQNATLIPKAQCSAKLKNKPINLLRPIPGFNIKKAAIQVGKIKGGRWHMKKQGDRPTREKERGKGAERERQVEDRMRWMDIRLGINSAAYTKILPGVENISYNKMFGWEEFTAFGDRRNI